MIQVWYNERLIAEDLNATAIEAIFNNYVKADSIVLHIEYIKGSEDSVSIRPVGLDEKLPGEYPIQRLVDGNIVNISIVVNSSGNYAIPIPIVKAWDQIKLYVAFTGDLSSPGTITIYVLSDHFRG